RAHETFVAATAKAQETKNPADQQAATEAGEAQKTLQYQADHTVYFFTFDQVYTPLSATIYALLAFYVASAAFRAFRAKNLHSALLLIAAIFVMIGRVPVGGVMWEGFPKIQEWIMVWPNTAGQRAILIGAGIGMIATGLRIIFGIERPYLKG
ncbi:MAG: hypothetical protein V2A74_09760, partial [bacterium]